MRPSLLAAVVVVVIGVGASLGLSGCASSSGGGVAGTGSPGSTPSPPAPTSGSASAVPSPSMRPAAPGGGPTLATGPESQAAVDQAVRDAAGRLNLSPSDVHVEQVEAREWPDASLGCPGQAEQSAQVVTPGFLIVLSGGGKRLEYHADARGHTRLCDER